MPNAEDILLSGREVKLTNGDYVQIKPWSLRVGRRVLEPVNELLQVSTKHPDAKIPQLIDLCFDEMRQIAKVTLDWDDAKLDELLLEDFVELSTVILEVCLVRDDGGGLMGKMMRFGNRGGNLLLTAALGPEKAAVIMAAQESAIEIEPEPTKPEPPETPTPRRKTPSHKS